MSLLEEISDFKEKKIKIAKELGVDIEKLTHLTHLTYTDSSYNGYTYGSTVEEWLRMVIPMYAKV